MFVNKKKLCTKCGESKLLALFDRHNTCQFGRNSVCKACRSRAAQIHYARPEVKRRASVRQRAWRLANRDHIRVQSNAYAKTPRGRAVTRAAHARWEKSAGGKAWHKRWKSKNRRKLRAQEAARYAVRVGQLERRKTCQHCRRRCKTVGHHHHGYSWAHRLDVVWLCPTCHYWYDRRPAARRL